MNRLAILERFCIPDSSLTAVQRPWSYAGADWATDGMTLLRMNGSCECMRLSGPRARVAWGTARAIRDQRRKLIRTTLLGVFRSYLCSLKTDTRGDAPFVIGACVVNARLILLRLRGLKAESIDIRAPGQRMDPIEIRATDGAWSLYVMPMLLRDRAPVGVYSAGRRETGTNR